MTQGQVAVIDDEDYEAIEPFKWHAKRYTDTSGQRVKFYAGRSTCVDGVSRILRMHRVIMNASPDQIVDHRDNDGLNNRRYNLRFVTHSQNMRNSRKQLVPSGSKYKGSYPQGNRWCAHIRVGPKTIYLGSYLSEEEAARAYDRAALERFGEFAGLNFKEGL